MLDGARRDVAWRLAGARRQRRGDAGRLSGEPALRDLAQEGVRAGVAGDVPARAQDVVELGRHQRAVGHGDVGKLRRQRGRYADLVVPDLAGVPLLARDLAQTVEPPAVAHADLRRAQHEEGVGKARRRGPVDLEVAGRELARAQLDRGQVLDVDGAVAGQPRPHEQGDVVAPGDERLLEELELLAAQRHELGEAIGLLLAEGEPPLHVDAARAGRPC